jgi:hypothetical protein
MSHFSSRLNGSGTFLSVRYVFFSTTNMFLDLGPITSLTLPKTLQRLLSRRLHYVPCPTGTSCQQYSQLSLRHKHNFSMNSFYIVRYTQSKFHSQPRLSTLLQDGLHPFAKSMSDFLYESGNRSKRPGIVQTMMVGTNAKYENDKNVMLAYVNDSMYL